MPLILYGIPNCDTVRKARTWLANAGIAYNFHDYKKAGIDPATLERWARDAGWETLLNKAGTTFRNLAESDKSALDEAKALRLMIANPSLIKRPVLDGGDRLLVGFKPDTYVAAFG